MKKIAACAIRMPVTGIFAAALLALAGCALPLPDKPVRPQTYDLGPALPAVAAASVPITTPLAIGRVDAPSAIDGSQIVYRLLYGGADQQPRPYAMARWVMSPPQLVAQRLREAFAATRPVVEPGAGLAPLELQTDIDEFAQVFRSAADSEGVVRLRMTVLAPNARSGRLVGQRTFTVHKPAATADAPGGVVALRAATDEVVQQVVSWVNALPSPQP